MSTLQAHNDKRLINMKRTIGGTGLEILGTIIPWTQVNDTLEIRKSRLIMLLACGSPSNPDSMVFGLLGRIDAEVV